MRYDSLTPHQYESLKPFVDTLLVSVYSPFPLDIALPHGASRLICDHLAQLVNDRFIGRMAHLAVGSSLSAADPCRDWLPALAQVYGHSFQHGVLLADRMMLAPSQRCLAPDGKAWLLLDWWQWLRHRVPDARQTDACMYLVQATGYRHSQERRRLGISDEVAVDMAREGNRLLERMTTWICDMVTAEWTGPSDNHG